MPQMFQQALWIGSPDQEGEGQEVDLLKSMTGAGLERSSAPEHFHKGSSNSFKKTIATSLGTRPDNVSGVLLARFVALFLTALSGAATAFVQVARAI
jgi:hypothetical protein